MPRRRRHNGSTKMQPLKFFNSPVFQPAPVLTPVPAVDNPITAKTVPVGEVAETSWVSPQFQNCPCNRRRCRSTQCPQRFHRSAATQHRHQSNGHVRESDFQKKSCKFKPLQFLNKSKGAIFNIKEAHGLTEFNKVLCECRTGEKSVVCHKCNDETDDKSLSHLVDKNCDNFSAAETVSTAISGINNRDGTSLDQHKENLNCATDNQSCVTCECDGNQTFQHVQRHTSDRRSVRRSFLQPQNLFCGDEQSSADRHMLAVSPKNIQEMSNVSQLACDFDTQIVENFLRNSTVPDTKNNSCGRGHQLTSTKLFDHLTQKTPPRPLGSAIVLAVDSPECDYGLTLRQRQLKYGQPLKRKKAVNNQ